MGRIGPFGPDRHAICSVNGVKTHRSGGLSEGENADALQIAAGEEIRRMDNSNFVPWLVLAGTLAFILIAPFLSGEMPNYQPARRRRPPRR